MDGRPRVFSGSPYEPVYGYCRALRIGDRIEVSGTAPVFPDGRCPEDAASQAARCFEIVLEALTSLGATAADVVRTRMYIVDAADADAVGRAHAEAVGRAQPAATMVVVAGLLDPRWRVEVEASAIAGSANSVGSAGPTGGSGPTA